MAYEWLMDNVVDPVSSAFSETGIYLNDNEWAADALSGAAVGAATYLTQKDKQKADRRAETKAWDRDMSLKQAPGINMEKYQANLPNGQLTDGGLIAGGMKP
jgi:hypothetical protein